jgi:Na+/H+ antiporter NhaC
MKKITLLILILTICGYLTGETQQEELKIPSMVFKGKILKLNDIGQFDQIYLNGTEIKSDRLVFTKVGTHRIEVVQGDRRLTFEVYSLEGILTLLPPFIAILLALIFKEVVVSLFMGIFCGALLVSRFDVLTAFFNVIDRYILNAIANTDRASILVFTLLLGGMVGIITKTGGVKGIVDSLSKRVKSARGTQFYTWLMGILIFFDDYTNTLIVGNTMRPLTDKWKISREKLAYIVDSTAAPMASIALISTWIGFEISLIDQSMKAYNISYDAYHIFLASLPYRFYPILALILVMLIFTLRRDFGPMYRAEIRASRGKLLSEEAVPLADFESSGLNPSDSAPARWFNGLIPIMVVILFTFGGLTVSGMNQLLSKGNPLAQKSIFQVIFSDSGFKDLGTIISSANSFEVLLWASLMGVISALLLAFTQRILSLREGVSALVQGMKSMMMAVVILVLAWSLGVVLVELKTADFLVSMLSSSLSHQLFPALVFVFSALIAFSTGTSWGTIGIMYPLVIPIIIGLSRGLPDFKHFIVLTISSVLAGAVFGDHCSPISDTTIMSSMASSCDHIDHVKTQIPYAVLAAVVALFCGIIPVSYGFPYAVSLFLSVGCISLALLLMGKKSRAS